MNIEQQFTQREGDIICWAGGRLSEIAGIEMNPIAYKNYHRLKAAGFSPRTAETRAALTKAKPLLQPQTPHTVTEIMDLLFPMF